MGQPLTTPFQNHLAKVSGSECCRQRFVEPLTVVLAALLEAV